jgi:hypothetical protein
MKNYDNFFLRINNLSEAKNITSKIASTIDLDIFLLSIFYELVGCFIVKE